MTDASEAFRKAVEILQKMTDEIQLRAMTIPQDWPPKGDTVAQWEAYGYKCAVAMTVTLGIYCGYVRVPSDHPDAGRWYDEINVDVHGGLTFRCLGMDGGTWFGFDCGHFGDKIPMPKIKITRIGGEWNRPGHEWTLEEVKAETESLARQLKRRAND